MKTLLSNYITAGQAGLFLQTQEEERAKAVMLDVATTTGFTLHAWTWTGGIINASNGVSLGAAGDPIEMLDQFVSLPQRTILMVFDLPLLLFTEGEPNPMLFRKVKDALAHGKTTNKVLLLVGSPPKKGWPRDLEKEFMQVDLTLPDKEQLRTVLHAIIASANASGRAITLTAEEEAEVLRAAAGLTSTEAENSFSVSIVAQGTVRSNIVANWKAASIRKGGLLEIIDSPESLADIGGLGGAKLWVREVADLWTPAAEAYGIKYKPRGVIWIGPPGTGKSEMCKAIRSVMPGAVLIRMDIGKLKGSYVGESEQKMRDALKLIEAIGPCVVWIDEVEKGLAGVAKGNGNLDSGASAGMFDALLYSLEEGMKEAFFVVTSNGIEKVPPEFLQRFDDIFFVDLPNVVEREEIISIWVRKVGSNVKKIDLAKVAAATAGFSGREIKKTCIAAVRKSFAARKDCATAHMLEAAGELIPTSKSRAAEYKALRDWAQGNARFANTPLPMDVSAKAIRKIA